MGEEAGQSDTRRPWEAGRETNHRGSVLSSCLSECVIILSWHRLSLKLKSIYLAPSAAGEFWRKQGNMQRWGREGGGGTVLQNTQAEKLLLPFGQD